MINPLFSNDSGFCMYMYTTIRYKMISESEVIRYTILLSKETNSSSLRSRFFTDDIKA